MFETDERNTVDDPSYAGQVTSRTKRMQSPFDRLAQSPAVIQRVQERTLDNVENDDLFKRLMSLYRKELAVQEENRHQQAVDFDFYDGIQLTEEEIRVMKERGQTPLVFNVCAQTINWMLGTERRSRVDHKVLPREEEAGQAAQRKSEILKYLSDVNRTPFSESRAFADAVKGGIGWMEDGIRDEDEGEPIYSRYESWRNILHDSTATELDLKDGRYIFRAKWTDGDIAKGMFPKRAGIVDASVTDAYGIFLAMEDTGDDAMDHQEQSWTEAEALYTARTDAARERVRLIECWFRVPVDDQYMRGGQFAGELFDRKSPGHQQDVASGRATVVRKVRMRMHVAIMCEKGLLFLGKSPYRHNQFPFTPIWCYRRDRDNLPYGIMRQMRDPQTDVNKRAAKALHIMNSNKVIMDDDAVKDLERFEQEVSRPDAIIVKKSGSELVLDADRGMEQSHLDMMQRSIMLIQSMSGVTDENMGRTTNATSGKAIIARQDQGGLATAPIFDNLRFARQICGEKRLSLVEQFMSEQKRFRITNQRGQPSYITVNDGLPENDIVRTKADFIIAEDEFAASIRQAQVEELLALMQRLAGTSPQIVFALLDLVIETMDVPQREEIVKRVRAITGQMDPDADMDNPDEETMQVLQAKQKQGQFEERAAMAELMDKEASAKLKMAQAEKAANEAGKVMAEVRRILAEAAGKSVDMQIRALEAAATIMDSPHLAAAADNVLASAGHEDMQATPPMPQEQPAMPQPEALPPPGPEGQPPMTMAG